MKVKLLEPIEGYEDVAEYKPVDRGDHYIQTGLNSGEIKVALAQPMDDTIWRLVLTPKPLPVVEPPKWLGVVEHQTTGDRWFVHRLIVRVAFPIYAINEEGVQGCFGMQHVKLIRTANIPTAPELEALFKEPQP